MENVDFIVNGAAMGEVAQAMSGKHFSSMRPFLAFNQAGEIGSYISVYKGGDPKKDESYETRMIQTNAVLRQDEWKALDAAVVMAARERLVGIADLESAGLVYNLGNAFGTSVLEYDEMTDDLEASVSMDGLTRGQNDKPDYTRKYMPIPIIHVDYQINMRTLAASRALGNPIDVVQAEQAARRIAEKLEKMLFTNISYGFGGGTIYSYINHPDRNPQTLTMAWDNASKTPADILKDVLDMKAKALADNHFGPYNLYIPTAYETVLDKDFINTVDGTQTNGTNDTIRQRLLKIGGIQAIKTADHLPANNVVLVEMKSDTVRLVKGMAITNVEWKTEGNMVTNYKVMTIQVPQIRSSAGGKSGIVHLA